MPFSPSLMLYYCAPLLSSVHKDIYTSSAYVVGRVICKFVYSSLEAEKFTFEFSVPRRCIISKEITLNNYIFSV